MNTNCDICYENKIIIPCSADINCKAMVCKDCYITNVKDSIECENKGFTFASKCFFCRNVDFKKAVICEIENDIIDPCIELESYVLYLCHLNSFDELPEQSFNKFCIPCDAC